MRVWNKPENYLPKKHDASSDRISSLRYEAGQRKFWAQYFAAKGKSGDASIQLKKHKQAVKALKTLGVIYK